jgi:hypothetical protein
MGERQGLAEPSTRAALTAAADRRRQSWTVWRATPALSGPRTRAKATLPPNDSSPDRRLDSRPPPGLRQDGEPRSGLTA